MNRQEHLQWCKDRALEYVKNGDMQGAYASFVSDMRKHSETADHAAIMPGMSLMMGGHLDTAPEMEEFIDGFN